MASRYQNFIKGIGLVPNATDANTKKGDLNVTSANGKLNYHNGTSSSPAVTEAHTAELTNKTIGDSLPFKGSTSGTTTIIATGVASGTLTLPAATDTLVGKATNDILTNKTLSGNTATNLVNGSGTINFNSSGTITVPNATDTLVGLATSDILTNKTLSGNTATNLVNGSGTFNFNSSGTITAPNATDTLVGINTSDTFTNKTISGLSNTLTNIANSSLVNDDVTINGTTIALGSSATITASTTHSLTIGTGLTGTSFNGSTPVTIAIDSSVVTLSGSQSLSNKTLTNPLIDDTLKSVAGKDLIIDSPTGQSVLLKNVGSTAAIVSSTGIDLASGKLLTLTNNSRTVGIQASASASASYAITLPAAAPTAGTAIIYDGTNYIWGNAGGWNSSIQNALTGGGNITISLSQGQQAIEVAGSGGEVTLSSTPFGSSAPNDKTVVRLIGTSDTNTVRLVMSDVAKGVYLNGDAKLYLGYVLECMYIQSIDRWVESSRNF